MNESVSKMPHPWFRANNTSAAIGSILLTAEQFGVSPQKVPDERRLGRFVLPPFQRPAVWTLEQKVRFIESIWGGLPLGAYVYNQPTRFQSPFDQWLLDGQQRITAILEYVADKFPVHGHLWSELTEVDRRVFKMIPMSAMETQIEDEALLREIYDRLAYGGTIHDPKSGRFDVVDLRPGDELIVRAKVRSRSNEYKTPIVWLWPVSPDDVIQHKPSEA